MPGGLVGRHRRAVVFLAATPQDYLAHAGHVQFWWLEALLAVLAVSTAVNLRGAALDAPARRPSRNPVLVAVGWRSRFAAPRISRMFYDADLSGTWARTSRICQAQFCNGHRRYGGCNRRGEHNRSRMGGRI
jgi:hypothetical protein